MKKKAYGKINLSLHVYEKREDGYHNIESLITLIDIYDKMKFKKALEASQQCHLWCGPWRFILPFG